MTCPNCGMEMPEGSYACPTCGYTMAPQQQAPVYGDPAMQQQAPAYNPIPAEPAKSKTGAIVGIIIGLLVVVAAVVCLVVFVFGKGGNKGKDGKYVCKALSAFGMEMYFEVDGDDVDFVTSYDMDGNGELSDDEIEKESGTIKFDGDTCTITINGESLECEYDSKEQTITMSGDEMMGMELEFTKE